jgi:hypothetical protein
MEDHHRPIEGFPGYRVSREGEVQSCHIGGTAGRLADEWRPLKPSRRPKGYLSVNLQAAGVKSFHFIHHLVLETFVGPRPPGFICCHGDGDPANNRVENLRWDTYVANSEDMLRHGTRPMGSRCNAKLGEEEVLEIRRLGSAGVRPRDLAAAFGVTSSNIVAIVRRRSWRHLP